MRAFVIKGTMTAVAVVGLLLVLAQPAWVQPELTRALRHRTSDQTRPEMMRGSGCPLSDDLLR